MAHRGRLSTIAHVVNRPYEELLAEFEAGAIAKRADDSDDDDVTGDVKYHHGADGIYVTPDRHARSPSSSRTIRATSKRSTASSKA